VFAYKLVIEKVYRHLQYRAVVKSLGHEEKVWLGGRGSKKACLAV
jgi:hypothetical protein